MNSVEIRRFVDTDWHGREHGGPSAGQHAAPSADGRDGSSGSQPSSASGGPIRGGHAGPSASEHSALNASQDAGPNASQHAGSSAGQDAGPTAGEGGGPSGGQDGGGHGPGHSVEHVGDSGRGHGLWEVWHEVVAAGESYDNDPTSTEQDARSHWLLPPPFEVWVAVEDGEVLGTYKVGPNKGRLGDHVANASFMVSTRARGRGLGRTLGEHCLNRARERGFSAMQFNAVVSTNTVAVKLWRSLGFIIVGTIPDGFRSTKHGFVDFHIMYRQL